MGRGESGDAIEAGGVNDVGTSTIGLILSRMEDVLVGTAEGGGEGTGAGDIVEVGCCSLLAGA